MRASGYGAVGGVHVAGALEDQRREERVQGQVAAAENDGSREMGGDRELFHVRVRGAADVPRRHHNGKAAGAASLGAARLGIGYDAAVRRRTGEGSWRTGSAS